MKLFVATCAALLVVASAGPIERSAIPNAGRPGCRTWTEMSNRLYRNTDDPQLYWECEAMNVDAVSRVCPVGHLYLESMGTCIAADRWAWSVPQAPPSLGAPINIDDCECTTVCPPCPPISEHTTTSTTTTTQCPPCDTTTPCPPCVELDPSTTTTLCPPCPELNPSTTTTSSTTTTTTTTTACPPCDTTTPCPPCPELDPSTTTTTLCPPCEITAPCPPCPTVAEPTTTTPCPPCVEEFPFLCTSDRFGIRLEVQGSPSAFWECEVLNANPVRMQCPAGQSFVFPSQMCF